MSLPIAIQLPANFLDAETRSGYEVSPKLKKIWAVELDLLNELMRVAKKHDIKFQVFAGTLLGAIRHKGMIPWDDDIDVAMTREEYEKLLKVGAEEFRHPYFLQTGLNDRRYFLAYARLRNSLTTAVISGCESPDYNNGIYIDIFVLEGCVDSRWRFALQNRLLRCVTPFLTSYHMDRPKGVRLIVKVLSHVFTYGTWFRLYVTILSHYTKRAKELGLRHVLSKWGRKYTLTKEQLADTVLVPFEMLQVPVPRAYDEVLKKIYGNYLEFPPVEERGMWHEGKIRFAPDIPYKEFLCGKDDGK